MCIKISLNTHLYNRSKDIRSCALRVGSSLVKAVALLVSPLCLGTAAMM